MADGPTDKKAAPFDLRDAVGAGGLALLSYGMSLTWWPGVFLVPGAVLTYVALFGVRR